MKKAKMARFYGWSDAEMDGMETALFTQYWDCITVLEAQEQLLSIQSATFPHMKKEPRVKIHKDLAKMAKPKLADGPSEEVTIERIVSSLTGAKIEPKGVKRGV